MKAMSTAIPNPAQPSNLQASAGCIFLTNIIHFLVYQIIILCFWGIVNEHASHHQHSLFPILLSHELAFSSPLRCFDTHLPSLLCLLKKLHLIYLTLHYLSFASASQKSIALFYCE